MFPALAIQPTVFLVKFKKSAGILIFIMICIGAHRNGYEVLTTDTLFRDVLYDVKPEEFR